ncbi:hypothetical protein BGX26_001341 [Mortierella sp. AD094]|nr:hypothetical protein BGX26_001341 [Mortierella sp. AD094]
MEILRENFHAELPYIKEAIEECEFIAIDAEFSGLHTEPNRRTQRTTLEQGYEELRKSASQFLTVQIGISTFTFDPRNGDYLAKPFNFFVFPTTSVGYSPQGRCFLAEASSLDFLAKNNFDFNKWIYSGVQYMTKAEEESYRKERIKYLNNEYDDIGVDPVHEEWLTDAIERIARWKEDPDAFNFINIQTVNNYQKRLIHQEVRRLWGTELHAQGAASHITITKATEKDFNDIKSLKQAGIQRDIQNSIGFRAVIDLLSASGKPIVGHNIVVDLAYILAQFVGPLPPTMEGYKKMIHRTFPTVIDTKYVSYSADVLRGLAYDSNLAALENMVNSIHFMGCPKVVPHFRHTRYLSRDRSHEAGYDSYVTGMILIRMLAHITRSELPPPPPSPPKPQPMREKYPKKLKDIADRNTREGRHGGRNKSHSHDSSQLGRNSSAPAPVPESDLQKNGRPAASHKKFSYADAVHGSKNNSQQPPSSSSVDTQQQQAPAKSEENNGYKNDYYENSGDEYMHENVPEVFDRPFSIHGPYIKRYQNILHWGRSNHGCINLTSS